ncbi:GNAT family N-acetyltransferase [Mucilaginibacter sp. 10I4]|uniref:GNAT family N-acetyltransferase n=1 Tax=unclassified Mucilaginibacter TaxID=2617802 RepID=UPI0034DD0144
MIHTSFQTTYIKGINYADINLYHIMLVPAYQGRGLMTEAINATTRYAFDKIMLHYTEC